MNTTETNESILISIHL